MFDHLELLELTQTILVPPSNLISFAGALERGYPSDIKIKFQICGVLRTSQSYFCCRELQWRVALKVLNLGMHVVLENGFGSKEER